MARRTTGSLYLRGKTWWVAYVVNGVLTRESLATGDREEADKRRRAKLAAVFAEDEAGKLRALVHKLSDTEAQAAALAEANRKRLAIADAWEAYMAARNRPQSGPHTLADYARMWTRFTGWMKANRPDSTIMEAVTPADAEAFLAYLDELKLGPNRYNKTLQALRLVFRILAPKCNGMANPFAEATAKPLEPEHRRELSEAELHKVCGRATGELRRMLALGLYCGFRVADACLLGWEDVDLRAGVIVRTTRKTRRTGKTVAVPIHPVLRAILEETPAMDRAGYVLPGFAVSYQRDNGAKVAKAVRDHFTACKIKTSETIKGRMRAAPRATFHSLRHTLVSALARQGTPLAVVRELVGHTSEAVQRAYLHVTPADTARAVAALPAMDETAPADQARAKLAAIVAGFDEATAAKALKALARAKLLPSD